MHLTIGPLTITLVQMFILAIGISLALVAFNTVGGGEDGNKIVGMIIAIPVFLLFVFIAFFKISEMGLLAFGGKLLGSYFFDTTKKFQTNFKRYSTTDIIIKQSHSDEGEEVISSKKLDLEETDFSQIRNSGLL